MANTRNEGPGLIPEIAAPGQVLLEKVARRRRGSGFSRDATAQAIVGSSRPRAMNLERAQFSRQGAKLAKVFQYLICLGPFTRRVTW